MTLHTRVLLDGPINGETAFAAALQSICEAGAARDRIDTAVVVRRPGRIYTAIGQGLPGIVDCDYMGDGPLRVEDVRDDDGDVEEYACTVEVGWDTAYAYTDASGDCEDLHHRAIVRLRDLLPARVALRWVNEFTGDLHMELDGL
jgi:hypothetical protein